MIAICFKYVFKKDMSFVCVVCLNFMYAVNELTFCFTYSNHLYEL